jgi:hypothetical protein
MGELRGPHHGVGGHRDDTVWPCDGRPRRRQKFLDGAMFGARRMGFGAGLDAVERCGALGRFIQGGRLAEVVEEWSLWRSVEFNGAVVSSLESALRGS